MKIVLVGGGKVGFALCRSLVAEKHDVVLIEQDEAVLDHIVSRFDIMGLLGNGADFAILEQAGVQECDIFIALTEHDEVNMISAVLAKKWALKKPSFECEILNTPMPISKRKIFLDSHLSLTQNS
ncbi:putative potassium transporter peripheral membrane component [Streptococcus oralis SK313]|uniref:Putative potassium transporter peripheral membrane component n=1 Tax=Streptococcus oralis SK313 TaxID=1035190 RepID=F9Q0A3_STROR|nr:putative potassium transporter peripheral membrane component [Streptococcus oralis SK313]